VLILDLWWFNVTAPVELRGIPYLKTPIPPSNPQILNTHKEIWDQNELVLILNVWWFNIPASVESRGTPCLETPIPPSNPQIQNTHKKIWDQNEVVLILDVWWFNIPAPVELRGPPLENPNSTFLSLNFKHPHINYHPN
jgi:putative NADPH-quinone reductase